GLHVHVEVEAPVEEGHAHAGDRGIGDRAEAREDGGVVRVAIEEGPVAHEAFEEAGERAAVDHRGPERGPASPGVDCGRTGVMPTFFSVATRASAGPSGSWVRSWPRHTRTALLFFTSASWSLRSRCARSAVTARA